MAWDNTLNYFGPFRKEAGEDEFATTGLTVEVSTYLDQCVAAIITPKETPEGGEVFYCDCTITNGAITVGRVAEQFTHTDTFGIDDFTNNDDLIERVFFTAPYAITIEEVQWSNSVGVFTGTPVLNVGTTTTDPDEFVDAQAITKTTLVTTTITTFASTAISDGDIVRILTTAGTGTGPYGASLTLNGYRTPTSALEFNYLFLGF